uniref:Homeobox domain-containing protein n=1 Tax=Gongylonema pulchrum TaxID=637853 RepID=A0A183ENW4_9BILA
LSFPTSIFQLSKKSLFLLKQNLQVWFQNTRAKQRRSNRLSVACERYSRSMWNSVTPVQDSAAVATTNDPLNLMAVWAQQCANFANNNLSDEQALKASSSPCESATDAAYDSPLDLSLKDETATETTLPAEQISPVPVGGQDLIQDDCWSAASLIGFVQKSSETIREALLKSAKGRSETPPAINSSASRSHSEGESNSEPGTLDDASTATLSSSIWPSNVFMSQYSMLGANGIAGLQKVLEVKTLFAFWKWKERNFLVVDLSR